MTDRKLHPMDRLTDRIENLIDQVEAGRQVDWKKESFVQALETVYAGQFFTAQALADSEAAQAEWQEAINAQIE